MMSRLHKNHYFFAVKLPDQVKMAIAKWVEKEIPSHLFERWVHPMDYHITLAFLGDVELEKAIEVSKGIKEIVQKERKFPLTLSKTGVFGAAQAPRIFWAGIHSSQILFQIQKNVYNYCKKAGFQLDKKPFRPHITLARKWHKKTPCTEPLEKNILDENGEQISFFIQEIVLYKTNMYQTPKYEEIIQITLNE